LPRFAFLCGRSLNPSRFVDDAPEDFRDRLIIQWAEIYALCACQHFALSVAITQWQAGSLLEHAYSHRKSRSAVDHAKQFVIDRVYFGAPVFDSHGKHSFFSVSS
jgi:hypothetical protein